MGAVVGVDAVSVLEVAEADGRAAGEGPELALAVVAPARAAPQLERARDEAAALALEFGVGAAQEERVERRMLFLDASNEFHFHGRDLIAEGRGGVRL